MFEKQKVIFYITYNTRPGVAKEHFKQFQTIARFNTIC